MSGGFLGVKWMITEIKEGHRKKERLEVFLKVLHDPVETWARSIFWGHSGV